MKLNPKRLALWGGGLALAAVLVIALLPQPVPADFAAAARGPLAITLDEEGETRVRERYVVSAPLAGRVLRIELEPGDAVVAGETVLATFLPGDPGLLDARARAETEARVRAARAALDRARAEADRARAERAYAESELARYQRLRAEEVVSQEALDAAELDADTRRQAEKAAEFAVKSAEHDLEVARAGLLQVRQGTAETLRLTSPVTGEVLRRLQESEAVVPAGEPLLEVGDPADLELVADYLSTDAVRIRPGDRALVEQWGGEGALEARVRRVEPSGFMKISALGVEEQRVNVVFDFVTPYAERESLGDGYRVEVRAVVWEAEDVLKVPTSCLFRHDRDAGRQEDGAGWAVFTVEDGRAHLTPVEVGRRGPIESQILGGVQEGQQLITHPSDSVEDGVRVAQREGL